MPPSLRKTRRAWNEPRHAHFLTYSCYRRLPLLSKDRARKWVIDALETTRANHDVALVAYVIMPEHVHVLLCPQQPDYDMTRILGALKRPVAVAARTYLESINDDKWLDRLSIEYPSRRVFCFWQPGGGFDRNIFKEKTISSVIDYIHANPVRRELVDLPTDWIWSSARFWDGNGDVPLTMDLLPA